jgi:hypothetical protein
MHSPTNLIAFTPYICFPALSPCAAISVIPPLQFTIFQSQALCAQAIHDDMLLLLLLLLCTAANVFFRLIVRSYIEQIITVMGPWAERAPRWSHDIHDGCVWRVACCVCGHGVCAFPFF